MYNPKNHFGIKNSTKDKSASQKKYVKIVEEEVKKAERNLLEQSKKENLMDYEDQNMSNQYQESQTESPLTMASQRTDKLADNYKMAKNETTSW